MYSNFPPIQMASGYKTTKYVSFLLVSTNILQ